MTCHFQVIKKGIVRDIFQEVQEELDTLELDSEEEEYVRWGDDAN